MNPAVSYELDRRKIPHTTRLDYGGSTERYLYRILAYSRVNALLEEIDDKLFKGPVDCPIKPETHAFFSVKILFGLIQINIHLLKEIIAQERPNQIITFGNSYPEQQGSIGDDEPISALVLALNGWDIPVKNYPGGLYTEKIVSSNPPHLAKENWIRNSFIKNSTLFNLAMIVKRKGLLCLPHAAISPLFHKKMPVVLYGSGYNWETGAPAYDIR